MEITIKGVKIQLTKRQVETVNRELEARAKARKEAMNEKEEFEKILQAFGFKPGYKNENGQGWVHSFYNWFGDVIQYGDEQHPWFECWLVGPGLKSSHIFPGGWSWNPEGLQQELQRAIDEQSKKAE